MSVASVPLLLPATPDAALEASASAGGSQAAKQSFQSAFGDALFGATNALERADGAERAFVAGSGGLQAMVLERAQADVALSIASAVASRSAQAVSTILGMQI